MNGKAPAAEVELEAFRNEWRAEVSARTRQPPSQKEKLSNTRRDEKKTDVAHPQPSKAAADLTEDLDPRSYHDLPDNEEQNKLSNAGQNHDRDAVSKEPSSALEHYEHAVEKESHGQLGDSLKHYRKAFKLDDKVHELYKKKHFPAQPRGQKQAPNTVSDATTQSSQPPEPLPATLQDLVKSYATSHIEPPSPPTDASPQERCYLSELPEEILSQVLAYAAVSDVASMARVSQVCRRLSYLVMTEETVWKAVALISDCGMADMLYRYACDVEGNPLQVYRDYGFEMSDFEDEYDEVKLFAHTKTEEYTRSSLEVTHKLLTNRYANSWRQMYRSRPRIRFNGCYISTVNYTRAGGNNTNTLSWGVPVHIVTYYRYLRFFRDGTVISLLTTAEPTDVVHHLTKDNLHHNHGYALPSAVMKGALRGRWRLTGPNSGLLDAASGGPETEGEVLVETQGNPSKYTFEMRLAFGNAGKGAKNNKLAWRSYQMRNRLTDDSAPFTLKHEKGFYWSRVRSFS